MNKKNALWAAIVIVVLVVIVFYWKPAPPSEELIARATYSCDGGRAVSASFYKSVAPSPVPAPGEPPQPNGSAVMVLESGMGMASGTGLAPAQTMTLPQTISADGARYAAPDDSVVFWTKGYGAFVMENGTTTYAHCLQVLPVQSFENQAGGYRFEVPGIWNAAVNQFNANNSLFGPEASSSAGLGGVEVFPRQSSVQRFLNGVAARYSGETAITVDGAPGLRMQYDGGAAGRGEQVTVLKNGTIYNIYIGSTMDDDLGFFNRLVQSFQFVP